MKSKIIPNVVSWVRAGTWFMRELMCILSLGNSLGRFHLLKTITTGNLSFSHTHTCTLVATHTHTQILMKGYLLQTLRESPKKSGLEAMDSGTSLKPCAGGIPTIHTLGQELHSGNQHWAWDAVARISAFVISGSWTFLLLLSLG